MNAGKLPPDDLRRQVLGNLGVRRPDVLVHAALGEDSAVLDFGDSVCVVSCDPITGAGERLGRLGVHVACNDVAANGAEPIGVLATILLPVGGPPDQAARIMADMHEAASAIGIEIVGGHTEITPAVTIPVLAMTAIGRAAKGGFLTSAGARPGDQLIATKWAGLEGTAILASDFPEAVRNILGPDLWADAVALGDQISVLPDARAAVAGGATALHDATEGGLLGAAWEMAEGAGLGLEISRDDVPVHPATEALAAALTFDPLRLISSGLLLIAAPPDNDLVERLKDAGIPAAVVGRFLADPERVLVRPGERRLLAPPEGDELWRLIDLLTRASDTPAGGAAE